MDTFTSLLSGCTVFGVLGNLAFQLNVPPKDVVNGGGTGLAFISYPDAISKFDAVPWVGKFDWYQFWWLNIFMLLLLLE